MLSQIAGKLATEVTGGEKKVWVKMILVFIHRGSHDCSTGFSRFKTTHDSPRMPASPLSFAVSNVLMVQNLPV